MVLKTKRGKGGKFTLNVTNAKVHSRTQVCPFIKGWQLRLFKVVKICTCPSINNQSRNYDILWLHKHFSLLYFNDHSTVNHFRVFHITIHTILIFFINGRNMFTVNYVKCLRSPWKRNWVSCQKWLQQESQLR